MNIRKIAMSAVVVTLTAGMALPVSALSVNGATDVAAGVDSRLENALGIDVSGIGSLEANSTTSHQGSGVSGSGSVEVSGNINSSSSSDDSVGIGASIKAMLSALIDGSTNNNADDAANGSTRSADGNSTGLFGIGGTVSSELETVLLTRDDVEKGNFVVSTTNAAAVNNAAEMRSYISAEMNEDANLESVEVADDAVEVTYKQKARLFTLIPVTVKATAIVRTDGDVKVSYPWYSFLMSTDKAELETKIQKRVSGLVDAMADVSAALDASASVSAGENGASTNVNAEMAARVTSRAQAMIVSEVKAAMAESLAEAEAATDVRAGVSADATVNGSSDIR